MLPDTAVKLLQTSHFTAYLMNYGIAPHFKNSLLNLVRILALFSLSLNESLNPVMQDCQMDLNICYWNKSHHFKSLQPEQSHCIGFE